ncbi:hypothetical protein [Kibdelosporangium phytohabitans]|uniref:Uncharacterized protein n=1 Tax=Kibdelosporangium phytohabitans TaxID=860235 RepID=A0A0N9I3E8_9PSEU|nr:hypothetical protein [Kibdelosporangium phytohabitans]ALG09288.1 hypothetical protein AOZ06_22375 [Kibdelosporangium phytohabitans]MBE1469460.1 hypothetical protein [Kibdelosporangium phytohabitans]
MSVDSVSVSVGGYDSVGLWVSRSEERAYLVIDTKGSHCEIEMGRTHVETMRDQLPQVLAGLDRLAAEDAGCAKARTTQRLASDAAAQALELAATAEAQGAHHVAESLRVAAREAAAKADTVDGAVLAFEAASAEAGDATERLAHLTGETKVKLNRGDGSALAT